MRFQWLALVVMAVVMAFGVCASAQAQQMVKARDVLANPQSYVNEVVTIEGLATQWVESTASTTSFYVLKDDWGGVIKVRTSQGAPDTNVRYRVTGPIGIDPTSRDVYISEERRVAAVAEVGGAVPVAEEGIQEQPAGLSKNLVLLIVAIVVALGILIGLLVWLSKSRGGPAGAEISASTAPADLPSPTVIEGRTIKIAAPPPGTLKFLPGRLAVESGDESVKEIRFYGIKGQSTPEVTFGRAAGAPYTHVELKGMTVSRRQAKMTFINSEWVLTNFASSESNPTVVNGKPLPVDGQTALKDGDKVELGEIKFVFHKS